MHVRNTCVRHMLEAHGTIFNPGAELVSQHACVLTRMCYYNCGTLHAHARVVCLASACMRSMSHIYVVCKGNLKPTRT